RGCTVFTRPSSSSGNPVTSATAVTGTPASSRVRAVLPVETSSTPLSTSARANATTPDLSATAMRARRAGTTPSLPISVQRVEHVHAPPLDLQAPLDHPPGRPRVDPVLDLLDAGVQRGLVVVQCD